MRKKQADFQRKEAVFIELVELVGLYRVQEFYNASTSASTCASLLLYRVDGATWEIELHSREEIPSGSLRRAIPSDVVSW